jgi:3-isopropylmalate/(R)-2-methylmalate dehydratase small subunit
MSQVAHFTSRVVLLMVDNIDTDQIIPARFLKTTSKDGLADQLFYDWRYDADGRPRAEFALNYPAATGAQILLAGHNFGCGSSREHAPWALGAFGFRAVIATSFADIFRQNALKNGLLPIAVPRPAHRRLLDLISTTPDTQLTVDLERQVVVVPDGSSIGFAIDPFARQCLLAGVDEIGYVLEHADAISRYEARRPLSVNTLAG